MKTWRSVLALGALACLWNAGPAHAQDAPAASAAEPAPDAREVSTDRRERAGEILRQMLPPEIAAGMASETPTAPFGAEMSRLAFENVYVQLWTRPGLSLKERSLITISILIALGNEKELAIHLASGLRNGLTPEELEEVIYHSSAYAGFPKASDALAIATEVVARERAREAVPD